MTSRTSRLALASLATLGALLLALVGAPNGARPPSVLAATNITWTSYNDFSAACPGGGAPGNTNVSVTNRRGGEVTLAATFEDDFQGNALDTSVWRNGRYDGDTTSPPPSVAGSAVTIANANGAPGQNIQTLATYNNNPPLTLTGVVTFTNGVYQHFGFATQDFQPNTYAIFSTYNTTDTLYVRTNSTGNTDDDKRTTVKKLSELGPGPHTYTIRWQHVVTNTVEADRLTYLLDDQLVATHDVQTFTRDSLRVTLSNKSSNATTPLQAGLVRLLPLRSSSGTYVSCPADAGQAGTAWQSAGFVADRPSGTAAALFIQASDDRNALLNATQWVPVNASGQPTQPVSGRYARYKLELSTGSLDIAPSVNSVTLSYGAVSATSTPTVPVPTPSATPPAVGPSKAIFVPIIKKP